MVNGYLISQHASNGIGHHTPMTFIGVFLDAHEADLPGLSEFGGLENCLLMTPEIVTERGEKRLVVTISVQVLPEFLGAPEYTEMMICNTYVVESIVQCALRKALLTADWRHANIEHDRYSLSLQGYDEGVYRMPGVADSKECSRVLRHTFPPT